MVTGAAVVVGVVTVVVTVVGSVFMVVGAALVEGGGVMTLRGLEVGGAEVGSLNWGRKEEEEEGRT